ncbi:DUF2155 domain-containing protein [Entomobacter blattae]|uniref:DUF2155 domain-containing protein n=1 Tax=Entomobacter blattae TaxID=2762277 RepID=A0A7H1NQ72_9PROT|nr:DUF2155 domain-containing protein [Entomobacter blattae]QNT77932.1 hypothetical protein JGUZn3_06900 [Entomobacter blattae]
MKKSLSYLVWGGVLFAGLGCFFGSFSPVFAAEQPESAPPESSPSKPVGKKEIGSEKKGKKGNAVEAIKNYSPESWQGKTEANIRILDRIENSTKLMALPVGQSLTYKTLQIEAKSCIKRPEGLPPDAAVFLSIQDTQTKTSPFNAWMFQAEPALSVFQNAIYNVQLIGCSGQDVAPFPTLLAEQSSAEVSPQKTMSEEEPMEGVSKQTPATTAPAPSLSQEPSAENPDPAAP